MKRLFFNPSSNWIKPVLPLFIMLPFLGLSAQENGKTKDKTKKTNVVVVDQDKAKEEALKNRVEAPHQKRSYFSPIKQEKKGDRKN